ncbi:hypothetical protein CLV86_0215 [Lacinutrix venerupis]|nr:hypothetical protein CLV86_0215 [Lacinutrix venerupis]
MKNGELKSLHTDKKKFILGSFIALMIAISPYLFYLYESVPDDKVWDTFLFTYDSNFYESAQIAFWTLSNKLIPLYFLILWFFTCRHWWHHAIIIPILTYIFQIAFILNEDMKYVDSFQFKYSIPIMAIIIPSIYLIRARIFNRLNTVDKTTQELEDELKFKPKTFWGKVKQYF